MFHHLRGIKMSQYLYRHFDKDNVLLYVGISYNALARLNQHKNKAHWFKDITNITIEPFETRKEVEEAELQAIRLEKPKHNIQGVSKTSADGVLLKWRKPKYLIKGKRLLPKYLIPLYLKILKALEPDKTWYDLVVSYEDLKALKNLMSFRFNKEGNYGVVNIIMAVVCEGLLTKKVEISELARATLIQARDAGDTYIEKEYKILDNLYSSSWYI
jgi:predicted GIY-YIG superfamily endonuclease